MERQNIELSFLESPGQSSDPHDAGVPWTMALPEAGNLTTSLPLGTQRIDNEFDHTLDNTVHLPCFDIDFPARLVPSRCEGHFHLYLDVPVPTELYWELLDVMARCGIVEPGWVRSGQSGGFTAVRREGTFEPHGTTRAALTGVVVTAELQPTEDPW